MYFCHEKIFGLAEGFMESNYVWSKIHIHTETIDIISQRTTHISQDKENLNDDEHVVDADAKAEEG